MTTDVSLPEPDLRFLRPEQGVRDTATASAIEGLGNLALEANKVFKTKRLEEDLGSNLAMLSDDEKLTLSTAEQEMLRVERLKASGLNENTYRLRAETILKKHLAAAPALSRELRATAQGTLGFDPTGSAADLMFASQQSQAAQQAAIDKKVMEQGASWGLDITRGIDDPDFQRNYAARRRLEEQSSLLATQSKIDSYSANILGGNVFLNTAQLINEQANALAGKPYSQMSEAEWAAIPEQRRTEFMTTLSNMKFSLEAQLRKQYPTADEATLQNALRANTAQIDFVIAALDPKEDPTRLKNALDVFTHWAAIESMADPGVAAIATMSALSPNSPFDNTQASQKASASMLKTLQGFVAQQSWPNRQTMPQTEREGVATEVGNGLTNWAKGVEYQSLSTEDQELVGRAMDGYTSLLNDESITPNEYHSILSTFADDEASAFVNDLRLDPSVNSTVVSNVIEGAAQYAVITSSAAANKMDSKLSSSLQTQEAGGPLTVSDTVDVKMENGQVLVRSTHVLGQAHATRMKKNYVDRLNTSAKAMANIRGITVEEAMKTIIKTNPDAFTWIDHGYPILDLPDGEYEFEGKRYTVVDREIVNG